MRAARGRCSAAGPALAVLLLAALLLAASCGSGLTAAPSSSLAGTSTTPSLPAAGSPSTPGGASSSLTASDPPRPTPSPPSSNPPSSSPPSSSLPSSSPPSTGPEAGAEGSAAQTPPAVLDIGSATALETAFASGAGHLGVPGVQAAVVFADGQVWQGDHGYANVKARKAMTPDAVFDVGSITKTFIAADVIELAAEGRLSLDDPLARWLPTFPNAGSITLRQLLSHTSGLADYLDSTKLLRAIGADRGRLWTNQQLLAYVGKRLFAPGAGWSYSNTNFLLLGLVVAAVEGRPVAQALDERFIDPLGLSRTALQTADSSAGATVGGAVAEPYARTGSAPTAVTNLTDGSGYLPYASLATALDTAGAIVSDATDLARWGEALYGGQVLPDGWLARMTDDGVTARFHPAREYALGTEIKELAGLTTVGHSGACSGYRSAMRYVPSLGATVVVLVNEDVRDPDILTTKLIAALSSARPGAGRTF